MLATSPGKIDKNLYHTGEEIEQSKFTYTSFREDLIKQIKTIEDQGVKQIKTIKNHGKQLIA